ncbi:MAG: hypothetical protein P8Y96_12605 [Desulfuromonadales bacterium]|jgi:hypothetical protein
MKKLCLLMISFLLLAACGGSGGSSTAPEATALDQNDISTATGTYNVVYMDFYYLDGTYYFTTDDLDQFTGEMAIDIENNLGAYRIEWHDSYYGDFLDYGQSPLTDTGAPVTWENAYFDLAGDYEVVFYYDNLCTEGICVNTELRIRKISDNVKSLLSDSTTGVSTQSVKEIKSIEEVILDAISILE